MDVKGGLTRKTKLLRNLIFYCLNLHSSYGLIQFHPIKKPEPNDSGFPCRQEHRIIEPDMGGVANNHLTK
jgi:hypothetical protein